MSADTMDPGSTQSPKVELTSSQVRQLVGAIGRHRGNIRIEQLRDAHLRVVIIGEDGETVHEHVLFPSTSLSE
jgi:hypothetical protein